jgi:hypothetical protein
MAKPSRLLITAFGVLQACARAEATSLPPSAAATAGIPRTAPTPQRCQLVHRAARTWVGLGDELSLDDVEGAADAVQAVVYALDEALCALLMQPTDPAGQTTEHQPLTAAHRSLVAAIAAGAGLEITQILLDGANFSVATADLRTTPLTFAGSSWRARLQARDQRWHLIAFIPAPAR